MAIALGLVVVLLVSGVIEAFVTPSSLPTWARLAIGVVAEAGVPRLRVHRRPLGRTGVGATGDVDAADAGDKAPVSG